MISIKESLRKIVHYKETLNKTGVLFGSILIILALGYADYRSGFEFSFSLFYLVPVSITAWFVGRNSALLVSMFSAITWFLSNQLAGQIYSNPEIGYWNAAVRSGFFVIVTLLLTYLKQSLERERELSRTDFVTGITNSRAFYQLTSTELLRAKRYNRPFTFAYIDLDNFKQINDRFGHSGGDAVLKVVAETLRIGFRQTDITARMGGDEFVVFLPETNEESARVALTKVLSLLLNAMEENKWEVTFSIGAITFNKFFLSMDEVIRKTDELMYLVKANGKNNIRFALED